MKILFDHQLFSYQRFGGASRYFSMLLNFLPREIWDTTTIFSNNEYVNHLGLFKAVHLFPKMYFRGQGRIMNELNKPYSIYRIGKHDYDILHQTHFETYFFKSLGNKPMVTTFHDINFSTLNPSKKMVRFQIKSLERADKIISISENTKGDLINYFNVREEKISVIYHGITSQKEVLISDPLIDYPYILYVGTRNNHKNFERFIKAFALLSKEYEDIRIVCTYKKFTKDELQLFNRLKIPNKVINYMANENELNNLYQHALFFIFPSLYEGFGMPILEAMINHCPVVLARASCFPEIAQNAACYFDPLDIEDIYNTMKTVLNDSDLRKNLISKGIERAKFFSWEKCALQHLDVYKSLL